MSAARFDEPLRLRHLSADGTVPCPRGIPTREGYDDRNSARSDWEVHVADGH